MDVFDEIAAGLRPRVPPAPTAIAKRGSDAELRLGYDLAKKVQDMRRGFRIETHYGEIEIDGDEARPFAELAERLLTKKLNALQGGAEHGRR
mgnify:CR=1 FL=1